MQLLHVMLPFSPCLLHVCLLLLPPLLVLLRRVRGCVQLCAGKQWVSLVASCAGAEVRQARLHIFDAAVHAAYCSRTGFTTVRACNCGTLQHGKYETASSHWSYQ